MTLAFRASYSYANSTQGIEVPIRLRAAAKEVRLRAKVDTGADFCLFQREYGEQLGIEIESGTPIALASVRGPFSAYQHLITLICFEWEMDVTVCFAAEPEFPRNVVGRAGWLQHLRLGIVEHDSTLFIGHYND